MRLFHVSEEVDITEFIPRIPVRDDMDKTKGLVWAINEKCLPNFIAPRDCPRITYHVGDETSEADIKRFFSSSVHHCMVIEHAWYEIMRKTTLYIYELNPANFYLQDSIAGYYVSEYAEKPIGKLKVRNLFRELFNKGIEVRMVNNLWHLRDEVVASTLNYSICDMKLALPR